LQRFPYQLETWWLPPLFLTAGSAVLVAAMLAVAMIVLGVARRKPVSSLRYE
jgi:putative ABC transport system permease protein